MPDIKSAASMISRGHTSHSYSKGSHSGRSGKIAAPGSVAAATSRGASILDYLPKGSSRDDIGIVSGLYDDHGGSSGASSALQLQYKNADWAEYYGMDASTAYAESMQNTSYQRTVKDMQAAGLNPAVMFGNGANPNTAFYMGSPAASGGSSGGSSGSSSGRSAAGRSGKLFSSKMYSTISEVAGVAAAAITRRPWNYSSGKAIAQGAMRIANNLFRR
nr:pilot protein for DNA ejection [Microvirus sp.]